MTKQVIYEPKGRAKEYSELACNIFSGCTAGCAYCYGHLATHQTREQYQSPHIRITAYDVLRSAKRQVEKGDMRRPLFSFIGDSYDKIEQETQVMRKCIMAMHEAGLNLTILTKGGLRSTRDFDLLTPKDAYATTLTCLNPEDSLKWESGATLPTERIEALRQAHKRGIKTWVSFEPVLYPDQVKELLMLVKDIAGHAKIGKLNYVKILPPDLQAIVKDIDWYKFGWEIKVLADYLGVKYYLKNDLLKAMKVKPEDFKQTWRGNDKTP